MVIINTIQGNLLEAKEDYIAQQCNCITCNAHGLSQSIIDKWPHGDPYGTKRRDTRNKCIKEGFTQSRVLTRFVYSWYGCVHYMYTHR